MIIQRTIKYSNKRFFQVRFLHKNLFYGGAIFHLDSAHLPMIYPDLSSRTTEQI
jgi:hypothetical protein